MLTDLAAWLTQIWDEQERVASAPGVARLVAPSTSGDALAEYAVLDGELHASPTYVLDRIAADRQILELHYRHPKWCGECNDSVPCNTLRLLALPLAARPGYREEWTP